MTELARAIQDWFNPHWTETRPTVRESSPEAATVGPRKEKLMPEPKLPPFQAPPYEWVDSGNPKDRAAFCKPDGKLFLPPGISRMAQLDCVDHATAVLVAVEFEDGDDYPGGIPEPDVLDFIATACNSYAALVEALEAAKAYIPGSEVRSWPPGFALKKKALELIDAALALAKPKE